VTGASANFGPWADNLSDAERLARWRGLRAAAFLLLGSSHPFIQTLRQAESDAAAARRALAELEALPALPRRRLLACLLRLQEPSRGEAR
jgi:hypothetical protein